MATSNYQPGPAGDARVHRDGERWTLVFVRELRHPPEKVWEALTDPAHLREWAPFDAERSLETVGPTALTMVGGPTREATDCNVIRAIRPRVLEYTWDTDLLRWELEKTDTGTRLTLHHTVRDRSWLPRVGAGWHICLDVAEHALDGRPVGRIVAGDARKHGWECLAGEYAEKLGIENPGWPENVAAS